MKEFFPVLIFTATLLALIVFIVAVLPVASGDSAEAISPPASSAPASRHKTRMDFAESNASVNIVEFQAVILAGYGNA